MYYRAGSSTLYSPSPFGVDPPPTDPPKPDLNKGLVVFGLGAGTIVAVLVGTTIASYFLVKAVSPKKGAVKYGTLGAVSNLIVPVLGPAAVGIYASMQKR